MASWADFFSGGYPVAPAPRNGRHRAGLLLAGCLLLSAFAPPPRLASPAAQPTIAEAAGVDQLTTNSRRAYAEVLKLRLGAARDLLRPELATAPTAPAPLLVANCADFAELIITQDASRYDALVGAQEAHLAALDRAPASALRDYARAEITLHLGLSQLVFRHLVMGGFHLRRGFQQMQAVAKRYPSFAPARKTLGICQFAVGSLPEGYHWLLSLLGLTANVDTGLKNLAFSAAQPNDFQTESQLYLTLIREGYYKKPEEAVRLVERLHAQQPDNLLFSYLLISVYKRQHHGEAALAAYRARPVGPGYLSVAYLRHMAADLLLYQGNYAGSERENLAFLREYKGQHYRKDTAFKLYLAVWLSGQPAAVALRYREQINQPGPTDVEEDNYAQHYYHEAQALNPTLTRARLQIDGGYNRLALATLRGFHATPATLLRDRIEEPYRRARAYQGLSQLDSAKLAYERTLAVAGETAPFYFAPQAALQLGYMAQEAGNKALARTYFEKALHYPWHEYKNSTDAKANLALRELR
ncbi:hypothetical protein AUC43_15040 [Hymenobacter sedentarius]|uniref:DUF3808 domain-containing protein n=1 Tax=Hymenobacter sedentarius TaxID=1411621 RepID=A0A0U4BIA6_9BACT|nr:hypothetical protein [Hymenobacter sedentarius]ALW86283.1 hypothetical protein AUC43_15040 [Hymenobacter sedentarius]